MAKSLEKQMITGFDREKFNLPIIKYQKIDVCGVVMKMKDNKRKVLNINRERRQLAALIDKAPSKNEVFKLISVGGFSSISIIKYIAELETIEELYVSTFRIGKPHFEELLKLHKKNQIKNAYFITSEKQAGIDSTLSINYFKLISNECKKIGWKVASYNNHSKIILMKTKNNNYIVETSSNLSENYKMEQFNWENDKGLYEWYEGLFKELIENGGE